LMFDQAGFEPSISDNRVRFVYRSPQSGNADSVIVAPDPTD